MHGVADLPVFLCRAASCQLICIDRFLPQPTTGDDVAISDAICHLAVIKGTNEEFNKEFDMITMALSDRLSYSPLKNTFQSKHIRTVRTQYTKAEKSQSKDCACPCGTCYSQNYRNSYYSGALPCDFSWLSLVPPVSSGN